MAARKKSPAKATPANAHLTVVLEDMRSQFNVFGEALGVVGEAVRSLREDVDRRFEKTDGKLGRLELAVVENGRAIKEVRRDLLEVRSEVGGIRSDLLEVRSEVGGLRSDLLEVRSEVGGLRSDLLEVRSEVGGLRSDLLEVRATVTRIESALPAKVDRTEIEPIVERLLARR